MMTEKIFVKMNKIDNTFLQSLFLIVVEIMTQMS